MTDRRSTALQSARVGAETDTPRKTWEAPTLSRLSAGAAEVGYEANVADGNFSQS